MRSDYVSRTSKAEWQAVSIGAASGFLRAVGLETEADQAALRVQFLVPTRNCFGIPAYLAAQSQRLYPNRFTCLAGKRRRKSDEPELLKFPLQRYRRHNPLLFSDHEQC